MSFAEDLYSINKDLTPEVMARVDEIIARHRGTPGSLIPVLEECQGVTAYLPVELQEYIARGLNMPASTVYGVVTFYSFFSMIPKGRHTVRVCMGTACYVRGMNEIVNRIRSEFNIEIGNTMPDRRFSLESVRCTPPCGLAPVVMVDSDTHGGVTPERIVDILNRYK